MGQTTEKMLGILGGLISVGFSLITMMLRALQESLFYPTLKGQ
ncbi:hypothetical protein [Salipaludibacillus sp. LMS25]|jgi:hypothetical protein|nr:hypothetical protein [Salipaludibacillus sp. LMS25]